MIVMNGASSGYTRDGPKEVGQDSGRDLLFPALTSEWLGRHGQERGGRDLEDIPRWPDNRVT